MALIKQGATGDGKGTAAIGNLLKGRGTKDGSQGDGGKAGNAGDPLGGDGNGDSKIGVDRKLTGYIPVLWDVVELNLYTPAKHQVLLHWLILWIKPEM